jgi:hypothetical protein
MSLGHRTPSQPATEVVSSGARSPSHIADGDAYCDHIWALEEDK